MIPTLDKFEFKEKLPVTSRFIVSDIFYTDFKLFGTIFYVGTAYRAEMEKKTETTAARHEDIVEITGFIFNRPQTYVNKKGESVKRGSTVVRNYVKPSSHGSPHFTLGNVHFSNIENKKIIQ